MKTSTVVVALMAVLLLCAGQTFADTVTLTMDELPFQPINGLTVKGVTFGFTSLDANYHSGGPGCLTFVCDPSIEGTTTGVLSFTFSSLVSSFSFGVAESTQSPLSPLFTVDVFDASGALVSSTGVNTALIDPFSEASFAYTGVPIGSVQVTFAAPNTRFAFDNLVYTSTVPEPCSLILLGTGVVGGILRRKFHK